MLHTPAWAYVSPRSSHKGVSHAGLYTGLSVQTRERKVGGGSRDSGLSRSRGSSPGPSMGQPWRQATHEGRGEYWAPVPESLHNSGRLQCQPVYHSLLEPSTSFLTALEIKPKQSPRTTRL